MLACTTLFVKKKPCTLLTEAKPDDAFHYSKGTSADSL